MRKITKRIKLRSYLSAVMGLVMVIFGLLRLPKISMTSISGVFTTVWLGFAILIIASHLRILVQESPNTTPEPIMVNSDQRRRVQRRVSQS